MDTTRDIIFRNFKLNDSTVASAVNSTDGLGKGIAGCVIDDFDPDDQDVVQFSEKRSEADGMDVGTPFLGGRRIRLQGTAYGVTRALCYDLVRSLRATLDPVLSSRESPADKGYLPMYFVEPTNDIANFPTAVVAMRALVMPKSFHAPINRDQHGGADGDAMALTWSAVLNMRDPKFEGETPRDVAFADTVVVTGATATASTDLINKTSHALTSGTALYFTILTSGTGLTLNTTYYVLAAGLTANAFAVGLTPGGAAVNITVDYTVVQYSLVAVFSGNFNNRGTYNSPLNMLLAVGPLAGAITVAVGGSNFVIAIPASSGMRLIRFKREKIITVEESGVESLRRSWLTFTGSTTWPLIPAGTSAYTVTVAGTTLDPGSADGSHAWFWEQYA